MSQSRLDVLRLKRRLLNLPVQAKAEMRKALTASADQIVSTQKSFAPVKSGALRDSIRHEAVSEEGGKIAIAIKAGGRATTKPVREGQSINYDYALAQEFGTQDGTAQPFFFPGYRSNKKRVRSRVNRAIKKAAKQAVQKS